MFRGLKSLLPGSLGLRVFLLYALSLLLTLTVGLTAFMLLQFSRHIDDAEAAATTLSQVMVQTIADSAVIGDYDTIEKTLRKALSRSPFDNASFIDGCGRASSAHATVKVAIKNGHAIGVTVTTTPPSPGAAACIDAHVRRLEWPANGKLDSMTVNY